MPQQRRANRRNNPNGYPPPLPNETEIRFVEACGLRRAELLNLRVRDIRQDEEGRVWIHIARQAGRREREVPVLAGREQMILARMQNARLFPDFPEQVDVQSARREYASTLYYQLLMDSQDPPLFREYDEKAVQQVMQALGHNDLDVVCRHFLGLQDRSADEAIPRGKGSDLSDAVQ
jgi:integrase